MLGSTMGPAVSVEGLGKTFRKIVALEDVTLTVPAASTYLLLGPNGSGKTTLIRLLAGTLRPTSGTVEVLGIDPYRHSNQIARDVGIAYESHHLPPWASARRYLEFAADVKHLADGAVASAGERFGLRSYWDREMGTYSSGMRKRVMLAQSWLGDPKLLVLDEPFSNIDPEGRRLLANLFASRSKEGLTTIVATHLAEAGTAPTHLACLLNGHLEADGPIRELAERYDARTVVVNVPDRVAAARLLLSKGIQSITVGPDGVAVRGDDATTRAAMDALGAGGIDASAIKETYDIWAIYRAVLLAEENLNAPDLSVT